MKKSVAIVLAAASIAGCTTTARLYPDNDLAGIKPIEAVAKMGVIEFTDGEGEKFTGEYSIVRGGQTNFGSVMGSLSSNATAFGPKGMATATGTGSYSSTSTSFSTDRKSTGVAVGLGDKGTRFNCEFLSDSLTGSGYGACKTSKGAVYRVVF